MSVAVSFTQHAKLVIFGNVRALTALLCRLSLSVGWENGPERGLKIVSFNP